jgi:hypothetical protein
MLFQARPVVGHDDGPSIAALVELSPDEGTRGEVLVAAILGCPRASLGPYQTVIVQRESRAGLCGGNIAEQGIVGPKRGRE